MSDQSLLCGLRALGRQMRLATLGRALALWALAAGLALSVLALAARLGAPAWFMAAILALAGGGLLVALGYALSRNLSGLRVAARVEASHPPLRDALLTAAQLAGRDRHDYSPQLVEALIARAHHALPSVPREPLLQLRRLRRQTVAGLVSLAVAATLLLTWRDSLAAMMRPQQTPPAHRGHGAGPTQAPRAPAAAVRRAARSGAAGSTPGCPRRS